MKHRSGISALVAACVLVAPGSAGATGGAEPRPGAPGIGDRYFPLDGNGGYDVQHYDLDLWYKPRTDRLNGVATITARATHALSRFNLDLVGMTVHEVRVAGRDAGWTRDGGELTVRPRQPLAEGRTFTVRVVYSGVPRTLGEPPLGVSGFIPTDDGALVAGQPDAAATWFPANDHPRDAATMGVDITVPEHLTAVSNGNLTGTRTPKPRWTTWSWRADEPMAPYLTVLAIGRFDVHRYRADGIRFFDAIDPDLFRMRTGVQDRTFGGVARGSLNRQPEIIRWLEGVAGPYPFTAGGGIVDDHPELGFALETQTRPIYSMFFFFDRLGGDLVVVHELAHQWFGDQLRVDAWRHIWLNEGFATYMEFLFLEREGVVTAQEIFDFLSGIPADDPFWRIATANPGPDNIFDFEAIYLRGALALHALRLEVGDRAFFRIVRTWVAEQAGSTVTTGEFMGLAERISGRQLDGFFREWLFNASRPASLPDPAGGAAAAATAAATSGAVDRLMASLEAGRRR